MPFDASNLQGLKDLIDRISGKPGFADDFQNSVLGQGAPEDNYSDEDETPSPILKHYGGEGGEALELLMQLFAGKTGSAKVLYFGREVAKVRDCGELESTGKSPGMIGNEPRRGITLDDIALELESEYNFSDPEGLTVE